MFNRFSISAALIAFSLIGMLTGLHPALPIIATVIALVLIASRLVEMEESYELS